MKALIVNGKPVRIFLWMRETRLAYRGAIPVDRVGRGSIVLVQVEAFDKDHSFARVLEAFPHVARGDWEFNMELDPEHDIGRMGTKLPLIPQAPSSHRVQ